MSNAEPTLADLRAAVELACQPRNAWRIDAGRNLVLAMPRSWVLTHLETVAGEAIDFGDYWEYRRLLELAERLDSGMVRRLASFGLVSADPDLREAAEDAISWLDKTGVTPPIEGGPRRHS